MPTVLVIDDNPSVAIALEALFVLQDTHVEYADSPLAGKQRIQRGDIDLVIQDMNFSEHITSGQEGVALFHELRALSPDLPIILLTAWTHLEDAVSLVKAGAADYLSKPWDDSKLLSSAATLIELHDLQRGAIASRNARRERRARLGRHYQVRNFVYDDDQSEQSLTLACQVAGSSLSILIQGPHGSGKDRLAEVIHANSAVSHGPMVTLNCGALPEDLIESELFGAEAGAFAGVTRTRSGKLEAADGGTLLLDEVSALSLGSQAKLLQAIENGRFTRLGSTRERRVNMRILTATNADLPAMVSAGTFRQDLLYRINAVTIQLQPLHERREDILPLAHFFLEEEKELSDDAERSLLRHSWPGNVRELKSVIQRACVLSESNVIRGEHLMLPLINSMDERNEPDAAAIRSVLARHRGVVAQAAIELGLSRQALYRRMAAFGILRGI